MITVVNLSFSKTPLDTEATAKEVITTTMFLLLLTMQFVGLVSFLCQELKVVLYKCRIFNFIVPIIFPSKYFLIFLEGNRN